jgi:hypothetical protein
VNFQIATSQHKLANASKRDAAAQKTLGIFGALFLPGAFVSVSAFLLMQLVSTNHHQSLFSMTFFNWQSHNANSSSYVSPLFWIYWAVSIPLTILVLGWFFLLERAWAKRIDEDDARVEKDMNLMKYNMQKDMRHRIVPKFDSKEEGNSNVLQRWNSG